MSTILAEIKEGQNMHLVCLNIQRLKTSISKIHIRIVLHQLHGRVLGKRSH